MKKKLLFIILFHLFVKLITGQTQQFKNNNIVSRKVLLENYGGAKCGNCPLANDEAQYIKNLYPNEVAIINVHAGFYAIPNTTYTADFRTPIGNDWDSFFGISMAGNPNGMISRKDFSSNHIKAYTSWQAETVGLLNQQAIANISITFTYSVGSRMLDLGVKTKFLEGSNSNFKLITVLTEDGIIDKQLDYRLPSGNQMNVSYSHNNVLRESLFGSWGVLVNTLPVSINDSITYTVSNYSINSNYDDNNLNIVAFIFDTLSLEVVQVDQIKIQDNITGIVNVDKDSKIVIFPNPANSKLFISSAYNYYGIQILNSLGETVLRMEEQPISVSIEDLPNGIYCIGLFDEKGNLLKNHKFIKE